MDGSAELKREAEATEARLAEARAGLTRIEAEIAGVAREAAKGGAARARFTALSERKRGLVEDIELLTVAVAETRSAIAALEDRQTPERLARANARIAELTRERNAAVDEIVAAAQAIRAALERIAAAGREILDLRQSVGSPLRALPGRFSGGELHENVQRLLAAHLSPPLKTVRSAGGVPFDQFDLDRWLAADRGGQGALAVPPPEIHSPAKEEAAA